MNGPADKSMGHDSAAADTRRPATAGSSRDGRSLLLTRLAAQLVEFVGVGVQWSETSNSDDFAKNLVRARCEGRFSTSVLSPLGVVTCDLTA